VRGLKLLQFVQILHYLSVAPRAGKKKRNGDTFSALFCLSSFPYNLFPLFVFDDGFAESSWKSRFVLVFVEDYRGIHRSHNDRVKCAGRRICLDTECKHIFKFHILLAQKHQSAFIFVLSLFF